MQFYIFAWIASIAFGIEAIIGKLTSKYAISNPYLFNFIWALLILLFTIPIAIVNNVGVPSDWKSILIASFFMSLAYIFYALALYRLDVSILSPLFNFRTVFSVLLSGLLLKEILTSNQYFLIGIVFVSGFFVSIDEKMSLRSFLRLPIAIAMIEMVILSLWSIYIKKAMQLNGYWEVTLWTGILAQLLLLLTVPLFQKEVRKITQKQITPLAIMAIAGVAGTLASNKAYAENVSISSAIISLPISMIIAFLFSVFAPKLLEKHAIRVYAIRFVAAGVMLVAALNLSK